MIPELAEFDASTTAGILARAAIAVEDETNPAANLRLPDEQTIRTALLSEMRRRVGLSQEDWSSNAIRRIGEALDAEIDAVSPPLDPDPVLNQLGARGDLPPDLYRVDVSPAMQQLYGKHRWTELDRISETVREPDRDESLGLPMPDGAEPSLVKLFSKHYPGSSPFNDYTELVVGQPGKDRRLMISAAWRLYTFSVAHPPGATLFELLRQFCTVYGTRFKLNGVEHEPLSLSLEIPGPELELNIEIGPQFGRDRRGRRVERPLDDQTIVWFTQTHERSIDSQKSHAFMVMVINTQKYLATLKAHGW